MRHLSRRPICGALGLSLLLALALTSSAWAQREAVVVTKDGRQFTGQVVADNENGVVLLISGIRTALKREDVQSVEYKKTIDEQYQERKAAIAADNVDERYNLARWLFEERAYGLALTELDQMATQFPNDTRVKHLKPLVEARQKLDQEARASVSVPTPAPAAPVTPGTATRPAAPTPGAPTASVTDLPPAPPASASRPLANLPDNRLTEDQIKMIKIYEVRIEDRPAVVVPINVLNEVMEKYSADDAVPKGRNAQNAMRRAEGWRQLDMIFAVRAREYYPLVDIRSDPESIRQFRSGIHRRYVLPYCGSTECHGGERAGDFFLFQLRPNDEDTVYTNFYILTQYQNKSGLMIDRESPEKSLLYQYGLPRAEAEYPHPSVPGYAAFFRARSDPRAQPVLDFFRVMAAPAPRYPVDYQVPRMKSRLPEAAPEAPPAVQPAPGRPPAATPAAPPAPTPVPAPAPASGGPPTPAPKP
jgi:hypothetical protein